MTLNVIKSNERVVFNHARSVRRRGVGSRGQDHDGGFVCSGSVVVWCASVSSFIGEPDGRWRGRVTRLNVLLGLCLLEEVKEDDDDGAAASVTSSANDDDDAEAGDKEEELPLP